MWFIWPTMFARVKKIAVHEYVYWRQCIPRRACSAARATRCEPTEAEELRFACMVEYTLDSSEPRPAVVTPLSGDPVIADGGAQAERQARFGVAIRGE
jgi:hypothetical protein